MNNIEQLEVSNLDLKKQLEEQSKLIKELKNPKPKLRWRAKEGNYYYRISVGMSGSNILDFTDCYDSTDNELYELGNYYQTKRLAKKTLQKQYATQRVLDALRKHEGDWVADWNDNSQYKYIVYYSYPEKTLRIVLAIQWQDLFPEFYSSKESWEWVIGNMKDDILLLMKG